MLHVKVLGGGGDSGQCIEIVEKVMSVMMQNCGVTLLTALKVAEGGLSGTAEEL